MGAYPKCPVRCVTKHQYIYYFKYYTGQSFLAGLTVPMDEPVVYMRLMYRKVTAPKHALVTYVFLPRVLFLVTAKRSCCAVVPSLLDKFSLKACGSVGVVRLRCKTSDFVTRDVAGVRIPDKPITDLYTAGDAHLANLLRLVIKAN
jgi:hypothetical protein